MDGAERGAGEGRGGETGEWREQARLGDRAGGSRKLRQTGKAGSRGGTRARRQEGRDETGADSRLRKPGCVPSPGPRAARQRQRGFMRNQQGFPLSLL